MMRIDRLLGWELKIPFRLTFRHALAARSSGHGIIVQAEDQHGAVGFGECVPRSYVTGESPESVLKALQSGLAKPFLSTSFQTFQSLKDAILDELLRLPRNQHAAFCALELALLDLGARIFQSSVGEVVGTTATEAIEYSGVVSAEGLEAGRRWILATKGLGFRSVKFKIGIDADADLLLLQSARDELGPDCRLRVDANCAWDAETALRRIEALAPFDLESVEQPLRGENLEGLKWLTRRSPIPIIVDESLASRDDADLLIEHEACHAFNIRISKCGGLLNSVAIRERAKRAGLGFQLGAQVGESAILSAAGRHFAARSPGILFAEGSFGTMLLEEDLAETEVAFGSKGLAPNLSGPGLGIEINRARLHRIAGAPVRIGDR